MKTRHLLLAVILAAYTALGVAYSLVNPILEAPDENLQFEFVRYLVNEGRLPVYRGEILPMRQEASQPPLYYALGALISGGVNTAEFGLAARVNPHASIGIAEGVGNRNFFAHGPDREQPFQGTALAMHLVRWLSVALGAGTVLCTFLAAELLFPERPALAVAAAALNAFTPGFVFIASAVNNDNLAALAASAALVLLLKARQAQWRWPWLVGLGAALGAASLSKLNALGAIPAVGLAMAAAFAYENRGRPRGAWLPGLMRAGLIVGLTALAVGGWWYVRNYLLYGDLLASRVHFDVMAPHAEPPSVARLLSMLDGAFKSWWGVFGWFNIVYPPAAYQAAFVVCLALAAGAVAAAFMVTETRCRNVWQPAER